MINIKKSLFGLNRDEVTRYLDLLDQRHKAALKDRIEELRNVIEKNEILIQEIDVISGEIEQLEASKREIYHHLREQAATVEAQSEKEF